jgi:hypothetical protein
MLRVDPVVLPFLGQFLGRQDGFLRLVGELVQ